MILTMRTWLVDREHYGEFARLSEDEFWPEFEGLEGRALGLWVARVGAPERVVLMTRYASLEHWLATRSWGAAAAKLKEFTDRRERMQHDTDLVAMLPVTRRQPEADAPEPGKGFYLFETHRVAPHDVERFRALTEDDWLPWAEQGGRLRLVGCWRSYVGPSDRVYTLVRVETLSDWDMRCFAGGTDPKAAPAGGDFARMALEERRAIAQPESTQILISITKRRP